MLFDLNVNIKYLKYLPPKYHYILAMTTLSILHFNDVYRVTPQKLSPSSAGTFDVTQFSALLDDLRNSPRWGENGLTLFSGDVFSPSVESSVTRGSHMVT